MEKSKTIVLILQGISIILLIVCFFLKTSEATYSGIYCYTKFSGSIECTKNGQTYQFSCDSSQSAVCFGIQHLLPTYGIIGLITGSLTLVVVILEQFAPKSFSKKCYKLFPFILTIISSLLFFWIFGGNFYYKFSDLKTTAGFVLVELAAFVSQIICTVLVWKEYKAFQRTGAQEGLMS